MQAYNTVLRLGKPTNVKLDIKESPHLFQEPSFLLRPWFVRQESKLTPYRGPGGGDDGGDGGGGDGGGGG